MSTKTKKGQLEIGITTMVLAVFIVLLLISMVIYFRFTYLEFEKTREEILDQKYSGLLNVISGMTEFRCSKNGAEEECLDASKLHNFKQTISEDGIENYYDNLFGNANGIWIEVIEPFDENKDYSDSDYFEIYGEKETKGLIYSVPVSIYYPDYKKYKIGILKIQGEL